MIIFGTFHIKKLLPSHHMFDKTDDKKINNLEISLSKILF